MQDLPKQIDDIVEVMDKVGVVSAMNEALSNPGDYRAAFRSAWVIAKVHFYLGNNLSELEMVAHAAKTLGKDVAGRSGSKMAFIDREGRQAIIVVTNKGALVVYNDLTIELRGVYGKIDSTLLSHVENVVSATILAGVPFVTLCEVLDAYYDKPEELTTKLEWLLVHLNW